MWKQMKPAILLTAVLTVLTGLIYPLAMTGVAQALFPRQANGSVVKSGRDDVGSVLIGQAFTKPEYFHGRPSAAGSKGYDAAGSSGSNLGPSNPDLNKRLKESGEAFRTENPDFHGAIPADAITTSASGLDPEISPANAEAQIARVAKARGVDPAAVRALVASHTKARELGLFGEPRVNVLELNLALDQQAQRAK